MLIETQVDFIDACDLLKCQLSRMLAIVSASQQRAMTSDGTLSPKQLQEFAAGLYEFDLATAVMAINDNYRLWRRTGGQD